MPTTAFGPQGPNFTTTRPPADPKASAGVDTWFKNCSAAGAKDGTFATADFFNVTIGNIRYLVRTAGIGLDDIDDTMVYRAVQAMVAAQSGAKLTANLDYWVDAANGNDGNSGLAAGTGHAFATIQRAVDVIRQFNLNGYNVTVHVADYIGTYAPVVLPLINGSGAVYIVGNAGTPANTHIHAAFGAAVHVDYSGYQMNGFKVSAAADDPTGEWGIGISVVAGATFYASNMEFGSVSKAHMWVQGVLSLSGPIKITGGAVWHVIAVQGGFMFTGVGAGAPVVTITGALSIGTYIYASTNAIVTYTYSSLVGGGGVTGQRYFSELNSVISTFVSGGASFYPGTIAGATATGGQYV